MQGSTVFYVLTSERPEYNDKFERAVSLGPLAYMSHTQNQIFKKVSENIDSKQVCKCHL